MEGGGLLRSFDSSGPLVLDAWRHRQVPEAGSLSASPAPWEEQTTSTSAFGAPPAAALGAALSTLRGPWGGDAATGIGPGSGPFKAAATGSQGQQPSADSSSTAASLRDLRLSQGSNLPLPSVSLSHSLSQSPAGDSAALAATAAGRTTAEPSERRREAVRSAWRRLDPRKRGSLTAPETALALQRLSHLPQAQQEQLLQGLLHTQHSALALAAAAGGAGTESEEAGGEPLISYAAFSTYYHLMGSTVERDSDFEDLLRHHWGFPEVSDLLDDMKNKFAVVGLAYAFRHSLEHGSNDLSLEAFSEAITHLGMNYSSAEMRRLFDAFGPSVPAQAQSVGTRSLEVQRLMQQITSAPRPPTPVPALRKGLAQGQGGQTVRPEALAGLAEPEAAALPPPVPAPEEPSWGQSSKEEAEAAAQHEEAALLLSSKPPPLAPVETGHATDPDPDAPPSAPPEAAAGVEAMPPEAPPEEEDEEIAPAEDLSASASAAEGPEPLSSPAEPGAPVQTVAGTPAQAQAASAGGAASLAPAQVLQPCLPSPPAGRRRAVTVGVSYRGLAGQGQQELEGAIRDSDAFITQLTEDFGYDVAEIRQLRDDHPQRMPTRKNVQAALRWLLHGAKEGDHLLLHYSGHSAAGEAAAAQPQLESLVPCDFQQSGTISAEDLRRLLVQSLPRGARLTVILDCCHSGPILDLPYRAMLRSSDVVEMQMERKAAPQQPQQPPPKTLAGGEVVVLSTRTGDGNALGGSGGSNSNGLVNTQGATGGIMSVAFRAAIRRNPHGSFLTVLRELSRYLSARGFRQQAQLSSEHFLHLADCFLPEAQQPSSALPRPLRPPVRKALTIGVDYLSLQPGQGRLSGSIAASDTMVSVLKGVFGYDDAQIVQLRDDRANTMPTRSNILASLAWLTQGAQSGDELFFHFCGHSAGEEASSGTWGGFLPCDAQPFLVEELRARLLAALPRGCRIWSVLDLPPPSLSLPLPGSPAAQAAQAAAAAAAAAAPPWGLHCSARPLPQQLAGTSSHSSWQLAVAGPEQTWAGGPHGPGLAGLGGTGAQVLALSLSPGLQHSPAAAAAAAAPGSLTTAFSRVVSPTVTCEELLLALHQGLRQDIQLNSDDLVHLEGNFVAYTGGGRYKEEPPVTPTAAPQLPGASAATLGAESASAAAAATAAAHSHFAGMSSQVPPSSATAQALQLQQQQHPGTATPGSPALLSGPGQGPGSPQVQFATGVPFPASPPQAQSPHAQSWQPPQSQELPQFQHHGQAQAGPAFLGAPSPTPNMELDTGKYLMDSRISKLEQQIAQLRKQQQQQSSVPPGLLAGGPNLNPHFQTHPTSGHPSGWGGFNYGGLPVPS